MILSNDGSLDQRSVSLQEAAQTLRVCARTVRREIARGKLYAIKVGSRIRIPVAELHRYMRAMVIGGQLA